MAGSLVDIRLAASEDAGDVASVGSRSFREAYAAHSDAAALEEHVRKYFSETAVAREMAGRESQYLLARVDGRGGGMAKVREAACPVPGGAPEALELQQLYVLASMQGHGIGRQLVEAVLERAGQSDLKGVWLSAWEFADWATGFYSRMGFSVIGNAPFFLGKTEYNDLIMWRPLS